MVVETVNENLCINKLITSKKEIIMVEGDMIVPDSKPDVLNTICTSGVVCVYKKEILDGKIRIDGNINTCANFFLSKILFQDIIYKILFITRLHYRIYKF